ncbi:hypothetical protein [Rhizobium leguminosarum]|uniref:Uncharacterized protein n=1 Tax=Rhizobium leguminosarum TaxID=384 RepID=A0A6P0B8Y5_RHILE|nr:hypothetical protein [Rhizobium leguminosarum]MBY5440710.1 hypothetical protein [Rhizobium leguminosarum]NEI36380.1 hypothetical protein [Rhizobium leguminosarum]NEI42647.1 hypothetical protein [Rhizobium leguminosarum]
MARDSEALKVLKRTGETQKEKSARLSLDHEMLTRERDQFATQFAEACLSITLLQRKISVLKAEVSRRAKNLLDFENPSGDII